MARPITKKIVNANKPLHTVKKRLQSKVTAKKLQGATLTFSHSVENHIGNQQIGKAEEDHAVSVNELVAAKDRIKKIYEGAEVEVIDLNENLVKKVKDSTKEGVEQYASTKKAAVLLFRGGLDVILQKYKANGNDVLQEHLDLRKDSQYFDTRRQKVLNKHARHNLCFDDYDQQPDYENKKGTVVNFNRLPLTSIIRDEIGNLFGEKATNLKAEGNYYYDLSKTGIGFHGDTERRDVYGIRLGDAFPLHFQWFQHSQPVGERCNLALKEGDIYVMSSKAVGSDWKKTKDGLLTLRHAAGSAKYTTIAKKNKKKKDKQLL